MKHLAAPELPDGTVATLELSPFDLDRGVDRQHREKLTNR